MNKRLKWIRERTGETQDDLAKAIEFHRVQIARVEAGRSIPGAEYLKKFCEHYKVSADYLLGLPKGLEYPDKEVKKEATENRTK